MNATVCERFPTELTEPEQAPPGAKHFVVVCRLPEPGDAQKLILERQGEANIDLDEVEIIEDFFANELQRLNYDPLTVQVRIPTAVVAEWYKKATGDIRIANAGASKKLKQMSDEGQIARLAYDSSRTHGRGFIWTGENADPFNDRIQSDLKDRLEQEQDYCFRGGMSSVRRVSRTVLRRKNAGITSVNTGFQNALVTQ